MNFSTYQQLFETIMNAPAPAAPYDNPAYMNYVRLNWSRQQRWLKSGVLNPALAAIVEGISIRQNWTIITEPWCGDAAHSIPFVDRLARLNPLITVDYQLRDTAPFLIERYLTRGAKSIPKIIVRNEENKELFAWGPRARGLPAAV